MWQALEEIRAWTPYDGEMLRKLKSKRWILFWRAVVEIAGIVFLFYSNLLMGEFNGRAGVGKTPVKKLSETGTADGHGGTRTLGGGPTAILSKSVSISIP